MLEEDLTKDLTSSSGLIMVEQTKDGTTTPTDPSFFSMDPTLQLTSKEQAKILELTLLHGLITEDQTKDGDWLTAKKPFAF